METHKSSVTLDLCLTQLRINVDKMPVDMEKMKAYVQYFLSHLEKLLLHHSNPIQQAKYFGVIFNEAPTYEDLVSVTPDRSKITG